MKRLLSLMVLMLGIGAISLSQAQNPTVLRFTGQGSNGAYLQLSSVEVKNLTRGWEETLVYPDTILTMGNVGIDDYASISRFALSQNTPNPFKGSTDFSLQMPEANRVTIAIHDINGKKITDLTQDLPVGIHIFRVILNTPQTYLVTAKTEQHTATIKIINQGNESLNRIEHRGMGPGHITYEMGGDKSTFSDHDFQLGDLMCYVGKYVFNDVEYSSDTILQPQYESQDFHLVFHCVPLINSVFSATTCDAFTWNGQTYTQSGTYTQTFLAANGCDSIVTLNLTVGQPMTSTSSATACGSYVWNGQTYTQSGTYTQTFQTANGCDSVVTLNLTVNQSSLPVLSDVQVYGINAHTANVMASVLSDSCSPVLSQGFCWSTQPNPVVSGLHTDCPVEMTTFFSGLSGLEANQTYYVRAYATNAVGIAYSSSATFTTDSYLSFTLLVDTPCTSASAVSPPSADVLDYCAGMDSVRLSIGNYQYGNIQWQYSEDMFTWTDILGANDTVYLFQPSYECFIRARMQYPNCPPDSSQVSHIRLSPTANAGPDRVLNEGYVTHLFGNKVDNAYCVWQVIQGDSAELDDPTDRNSAFSGSDTLYRLTWTVDNACGVSTDTVEIRYVHTVMYDAIVVVDTTDIILSDSAELAAGIYRIVFSNPAPNVTDSTVLLGLVGNGFLRRVIWYENSGDTCEIVTSQASLFDVLKEGVISFETYLLPEIDGQRSVANGHRYTRAELLQDPRYLTGNWGAYFKESVFRNYRDWSAQINNFSIADIELHDGWTFQNMSLDWSGVEVIKSIYRLGPSTILLTTGFVGDLIFDFTIHAVNGDIGVEHEFDIFENVPPIMAGPVALFPELSLAVGFNGSLTGTLSMDLPIRVTKPLNLIATGKVDLVADIMGSPIVNYALGKIFDWINPEISYYLFDHWDFTKDTNDAIIEFLPPTSSSFETVSFEASFSIGPRLKVKVYDVVGPYVDFMYKFTRSICKGANGFLSEKSTFGHTIDFGMYLGIDLGLFDAAWTPHATYEWDKAVFPKPYKMARGQNTNRNLVPPPTVGSYIPDPIQIQVFRWDNRPITANKVLFETYDGVVSSTPSGAGTSSASSYTNNNGIAQIYWKPNNAATPTLKASVLDCEGNHIKGSPFFFYTGNTCVNSTLSLDVVDGHLVSSGYSGAYGYLFLQYSSDNQNWSSTAPYPLVPGTTYYVMDNYGCKASTTYSAQEATSPCDLTTNTYQNGLQVRFVANNGTSPYHFFVDGVDLTAPNGTTNRVLQQTFTQAGEHTFAVTDANGCTKSSIVHVSDGITLPSVATIASYNTSNQVYDAVMGAVTNNGGANILERGIQWSLSSDMTNATSVVSNQTSVKYVCHISGVSPGTTYYARAYAINNKGTGYGNVITITVPGGTPSGDGQPCPGTPTVTDYDGNVYNTVQIGQQCWMKENLRTTHFADGTLIIPQLDTAWCYAAPALDTYGDPIYGLLYNWNAVMHGDSSSNAIPSSVWGICPTGWHVPSNEEWVQLIEYVSSVPDYFCGDSIDFIGKALAAQIVWSVDSDDCSIGNDLEMNNATGFSALPSGGVFFDYHYGSIYTFGLDARFWCSTEYNYNNAWGRNLFGKKITKEAYLKKYAFLSVRCLSNDEPSISNLPKVSTNLVYNTVDGSVCCSGTVISDGGAFVTERGVCWSQSSNPTIADNHTSEGNGLGDFTCILSNMNSGSSYYVRAYATNITGTAYGEQFPVTKLIANMEGDMFSCPNHPTLTDFDGNTYRTVQIGEQCWMRENLRTKHYADGSIIISGDDSSSDIPYYYHVNSNYVNDFTYGLLYNWKAVMGNSASSSSNPSNVQGICPNGWHVPSDAEWTQMTDYVSAQSQYVCGNVNTSIGKSLAGTTGWKRSFGSCTIGDNPFDNNTTGFSALPAGTWKSVSGSQSYGELAWFWCSTIATEHPGVWLRRINNSNSIIHRVGVDYNQSNAYSVRCVLSQMPAVTTHIVYDITSSSAMCGGNVTSDGVTAVTDRGVCWSTSHNPTIADNHTSDGVGVGEFTSSITCLTEGNTYYVRAFATNSVGTVYGDEVCFIAENTVPATGNYILTTCDGWIYDNGGSTGNYKNGSDGYIVVNPADTGQGVALEGSYSMESGFDKLYVYSGVGTSGTQLAVFTGIGTITLVSDDVVTIRFKSDNIVDNTGFAIHVTCHNLSLPIVNTNPIFNITSSTAISGGNVTYDGGTAVTARGVCWSTTPNPTIADNHTSDGNGIGVFTSSITGLTPGTTYYVRAYATNSVGTAYGEEVSFTTTVVTPTEFTCGISTVTDHEGNEYHTVKIGNQCWTKENMRCVTSPSTGTNIVNTPAEMYTYTGKMAKWYNNDQSAALANGYGLLYNWNATVDTFDVSYGETSVDTNSAHAFSVTFSGHRRGICPEGWHVPTDAEWTALTNYLSSQNDYSCGGNDDHIAKAMASQVGWDTSYLNCTVGCSQTMNNSSGFNALPAGIYSYELNEIGEVSLYFSEPGEMSLFWSATQSENESAWYRYLEYYDLVVNREAEFSSKVMGGSVRCVYDEETFSSATLPTVTTSTVTVLSNTSAECGGEVVSDGGATVTVRGVCWSTSQNPTVLDNHTTDGSGVGGFVSSIAGLSDVSTYYVRAYATNGVGTVYGNEVSFITVPYPEMQPCPNAPTVTDYDGNVYNTVKIGNQCWMKENLRTTHYGNGSAILESSFTPTTPGPGVFEPITMPLFYHTDGGNDSECGLLYNWMAAMGGANSSENTPSGVQGVCPNGWHVPSDGEWDLLIAYAKNHSQYWCGNDSLNVAKSLAGASGWVSSPNNCAVGNNPSANNALGFSALPVGYAVLENYTYGNYVGFGTSAAFWSTTELYYDSYFGGFLNAGGCQFDYSASNISRFGHDKGSGLSVRCLRDEDGNGTTEPGVTDDGDGHCGGGDDGL